MSDLPPVVLSTGRTVTSSTAWWYEHYPSVEAHYHLFCIHNKRLTEGCNKCREEV